MFTTIKKKTLFKTPSTKVKKIAIRLMVNEIILSDELTIEGIQDIIESVIDIDPNRNDSIIVKSYRFTNLPLLIRIYKWQHWPKIYLLILISIIGVIANKLFEKYKKYQQKLAKQKNDNSQKKKNLPKSLKKKKRKHLQKLNEILLKRHIKIQQTSHSS